MRIAFRRALALSLLCAVLQVSFASAASDHPVRQGAVDQAKAEAETLFLQKKFADAYRLFSRLLRESPGDDVIILGFARSALSSNRPHQAIMAYEQLLEKYPGEPTLYKEIAQAFIAIGDKERARRYLEHDRTLDSADAGKFMDVLSGRYDRFQAHGRLHAGLLYDSNANQGPAANVMDLGNYRVQLEHAKKKESAGVYMGGTMDMGYRFDQLSSWWLVSDANFYVRKNENDALRHNTARYSEWYRVSGGVRHLTASSLVDLRFKGELFDYEWLQTVHAAGPELFFAYALTPGFQLVSRAGIDRRDYTRERTRNGEYGFAGQYARFFFGEAQHEFMAGGRYIGGRAEKSDYSYDGWEATASLRFNLPYRFEFSPTFSYTREYYKGPATVLERTNRKDERIRLGAGLRYKIDDAWSVEVFYQYTNNNSTSNLYEYDRHLVTTGIAWTF